MRGQTKPKAPADTTAERLRAFYAPDSPHRGGGEFNRITRRLNLLAKAAGLPGVNAVPYSERHKVYAEACKRGFANSPEAEALRELLAAFEAVVTEERPKPRRRAERGRSLLISITKTIFGNCGFTLGENVEATEAADLRLWEIGAVQKPGDENTFTFIGRVVSIDARSITLRDDERKKHFRRDELNFIGRVDPEPVGRWDGPSDDARERLEELREQLERLGSEDDQILRCSERYRIERQIFDILHPVDVDSWSEWEE